MLRKRLLPRRSILAAAMALPAVATAAPGERLRRGGIKPVTFVLVHGSWLGGWSWKRVTDRLTAGGHRVFAPTMTGVGDRAHLISRLVTLDTWVVDVTMLLETEELNDVVLVGHSFGGRVVTGVADRMKERLREVVFLDSALALSGQSLLDQLTPAARAARIASAASSRGESVPPPTALSLGVIDAGDQAWVNRRMTPQPFGTNAQGIAYAGPIGNGLPVTFVEFTEPVFPASQRAVAFARSQPGWRMESLETGHMGMVSAPEQLSSLLLQIAAS